ncbi:hypothetical protein F2981_05495 [Sinorhizobium meliloti]|nr:hypothetical protein [Sinorhizobium meliloti]
MRCVLNRRKMIFIHLRAGKAAGDGLCVLPKNAVDGADQREGSSIPWEGCGMIHRSYLDAPTPSFCRFPARPGVI